ncbi:hypothetical protein BJV77DRAFT_49876 [Russula vinacea]|nr:hypothetical protein BJV77DRAFT_49876 [Russula vinacea]
MGASMIMNVNTLPVALLQSLAVSVPGLNGVKMTRSIPSSDAHLPIFCSAVPWGSLFVGVTEFTYSPKLARLSTPLRLTMKLARSLRTLNT